MQVNVGITIYLYIGEQTKHFRSSHFLRYKIHMWRGETVIVHCTLHVFCFKQNCVFVVVCFYIKEIQQKRKADRGVCGGRVI